MTAVDRLNDRRIDHQGWVPEMYIGLLATALWMMQVGPSISTMSDYIEDWIALLMFIGGTVCAIGVVIGTKIGRIVLPHRGYRAAYKIQLFGLPLLIATLGWLTYASVDPGQLLLTTLAGGLGLCIEIGAVRLFIDMVQALNGDIDEDVDEEDGD